MTVYTDQGSFWDGCHLRAKVSTTGLRAGADAPEGWAEVEFIRPDGTCALSVQIMQQAMAPADKVVIRVTGDAQIMVLAEALEWAGRHLRELAGKREAGYAVSGS